jgi:hypothetical protein
MNSEKLISVLGFKPFRTWPADPELWPSHDQWHVSRGRRESGGMHRIRAELHHAAESIACLANDP